MILRFAFDMISAEFKKFVVSVFLIFVALFLIMFTVMTYTENNLSYISCDEVLEKGAENTAVLNVELINAEDHFKIVHFMNEISKLEGIYCSGEMENYGYESEYFKELIDIQYGHAQEYGYTLDRDLEIWSIDKNLFNLCDLDIEEGISPDNVDYQDNVTYLYLGSAYDDIEIGKEFEMNNNKFVVAGRLEEDSYWINSHISSQYSADELNYSFNCEYAIIRVCENELFNNHIWLSLNDGYKVEEVMEEINKIADDLDIYFTYSTIKEMYETANEDVVILMSHFRKIIVIMIPIIIIMLISSRLVIILNNSKQYGIMYSVGFSWREVLNMLLCNNIITVLCALLLSLGGIFGVAYMKYNTSVDVVYMLKTILGKYVFPMGIIMAMVIVGAVHIVTYFTMKKMTSDKLIRSTF